LQQRKEIESKEGLPQLLAAAIQDKAETKIKSAREVKAAHEEIGRRQESIDIADERRKEEQSKREQVEYELKKEKSKNAQLELDVKKLRCSLEEEKRKNKQLELDVEGLRRRLDEAAIKDSEHQAKKQKLDHDTSVSSS
jgi:hypothetical protein